VKNRALDLIGAGAILIACAASSLFAAEPRLQYVAILSRHGVRSPTWTPERLNQYSAQPWPNFGVPPGDLTPHGRGLIKLLGAYYGEWLGNEHLLGPTSCRDAERIYIWADSDQRTIATGRAFAESVLPGCGVSAHSRPQGDRDPLFSGSRSNNLEAAADAVKQRLGPDPQKVLSEQRQALATLQFILTAGHDTPKKVLDGQPKIGAIIQGAGVELQGPFAVGSALSEDLLLEYAEGMSGDNLGWGRLNTQNLFEVLALHRIYADLMRRTPELARARSSNLLKTLAASLQQASSGKPVPGALGSPKTAMLLLAGHDTNQSNVSGMLGLSWALPGYQRDETPPGGALVFSLWRDERGRDFVRLEFLAASLDQMRDSERLSLAHPPLRQRIGLQNCPVAQDQPECSLEDFNQIIRRATE